MNSVDENAHSVISPAVNSPAGNSPAINSGNAAAGSLTLVGLGPGDTQHTTGAALAALAQCDLVVGYRGYLRPLGGLLDGREIVAMELGQELERAAAAVDAAYAGRRVAVVSSGDAGIYGMAAPVFRVLTQRNWDGRQPAVDTAPGVSAMQSAAALLGAPLMQDFCAISLSDLLTPWTQIRRRLDAAAHGDFVVCLYNPRSRRRQRQLLEAREALLAHRAPQTPVGIVGDALRPGQRAILTDLAGLEAQAAAVDMLTIVIIGNSTTYIHNGKMITPRGYEEKAAPPPGG